MKHAIIITHGPIGEALIEAARNILGIDDGLHALSVTDMSLTEITDRLLSLVNSPEENKEGTIVMACIKGGSCWNVSAGMAGDNKKMRVISGVNLPMLLSFLTKRDSLTLDELVTEIEKDGVKGIYNLQTN